MVPGPAAAHALADIRARIDDTDRKLLRLLDQRFELDLRAGRLSPTPAEPARADESPDRAGLLARVRDAACGLVEAPFAEALYRAILAEASRLQQARPRLAGFQGERGAWSEMACQTWEPELAPVACRSFAEVFDGVAGGLLDVGVVPVENSLGGAIVDVCDLLVGRDVTVVGEVLVAVRQCLLARPPGRLADIRTVYSHPQALVQCRAFLEAHQLDAEPYYDTAGAARWLMFEGSRTAGAIASPLAARLYGLDIVADGIADEPDNETRFLVIAREPGPPGGDKCSVVLTTEHRSGALAEALAVFADHGINLSRIESRPLRARRGSYAFLVDFLARADDPDVAEAVAALVSRGVALKWLGCYRAAARPEAASS